MSGLFSHLLISDMRQFQGGYSWGPRHPQGPGLLWSFLSAILSMLVLSLTDSLMVTKWLLRFLLSHADTTTFCRRVSICHFVAVTFFPPNPSRNLPSSLIGQIKYLSIPKAITEKVSLKHSDPMEEGDDMNKNWESDPKEGRKRNWTTTGNDAYLKHFSYGKSHTPGA